MKHRTKGRRKAPISSPSDGPVFVSPEDQKRMSLDSNMQVCSRAVVVAIGINALGYREVLGIAVGDSEAEGFWRQFLGSLKDRGLTGTRLVISDAHLGLTAAIKRMFQGCSWQRCRVHFLRNLLSHVPKAGQDMVAAAM